MKNLLILLVVLTSLIYSQEEQSLLPIDIFIIDSYITPEKPHKFILSFSTSDSCISSVKLNKLNNYEVSKDYTDLHKIEIELNEKDFIANVITYQINLITTENKNYFSENYFVELPQDILINESKEFDYTQLCIGGIVYAIPTFEYAFIDSKEYFGLSKEIPLYNFYGKGYNYPKGYISFEYSHYLKAERKNIIRFGYKHLFQPNEIKYISTGVSFLSNLKGYNGVSFDLALGLFQIKNIFTFFIRYRYNVPFQKSINDFYEFSVGLYSNFFSINL